MRMSGGSKLAAEEEAERMRESFQGISKGEAEERESCERIYREGERRLARNASVL